MINRIDCSEILGDHPANDHPFGSLISAADTYTSSDVPQRALSEIDGKRDDLVKFFRSILIKHHINPEVLNQDKKRLEIMKRLGIKDNVLKRFPVNKSTQKGNFAEIVLAEYLTISCKVNLPVYRLWYNPNVDQSMKGNDVLAFDLDSNPIRIIVGESKFRNRSSRTDVEDLVGDLVRSYKGGIPVSLQFIADRLYETGQPDLGKIVSECSIRFVLGQLRLDYIGMLISDAKCATRINQHTKKDLHRLAVISFGLNLPNTIINPCYSGLEEEL